MRRGRKTAPAVGWEIGMVSLPPENDPLGVLTMGVVAERPSTAIRAGVVVTCAEDIADLIERAIKDPADGTIDRPKVVWAPSAEIAGLLRRTPIGRKAMVRVTDKFRVLPQLEEEFRQTPPYDGVLYPEYWPGVQDTERLFALARRMFEVGPSFANLQDYTFGLDAAQSGVAMVFDTPTAFAISLYPSRDDLERFETYEPPEGEAVVPPDLIWHTLYLDMGEGAHELAPTVYPTLGWEEHGFYPVVTQNTSGYIGPLPAEQESQLLDRLEAVVAHIEQVIADGIEPSENRSREHELASGETIAVTLEPAPEYRIKLRQPTPLFEEPAQIAAESASKGLLADAIPAADWTRLDVPLESLPDIVPTLTIRASEADATGIVEALKTVVSVDPTRDALMTLRKEEPSWPGIPVRLTQAQAETMGEIGAATIILLKAGPQSTESLFSPKDAKAVLVAKLIGNAWAETPVSHDDWLNIEVTLDPSHNNTTMSRQIAVRADMPAGDFASGLRILMQWPEQTLWSLVKTDGSWIADPTELFELPISEIFPEDGTQASYRTNPNGREEWHHTLTRQSQTKATPEDPRVAYVQAATDPSPANLEEDPDLEALKRAYDL